MMGNANRKTLLGMEAVRNVNRKVPREMVTAGRKVRRAMVTNAALKVVRETVTVGGRKGLPAMANADRKVRDDDRCRGSSRRLMPITTDGFRPTSLPRRMSSLRISTKMAMGISIRAN